MKYLILVLLLAACSSQPQPLEYIITEQSNPHITSGYVTAISYSPPVCRIALQGQNDPEAREQAIQEAMDWCKEKQGGRP